jgi:hypothetical protein
MPVHPAGKRNGQQCWQWGGKKVYCGAGAKEKADRQGRAAYAHGYKGHAKKDLLKG